MSDDFRVTFIVFHLVDFAMILICLFIYLEYLINMQILKFYNFFISYVI